MKITEIAIDQLKEATCNSNRMDEKTMGKLRKSIEQFGIVENLIVRKLSDTSYEVLSGNHRLKLLTELGFSHAPCVIVDFDDAQSRLLSQALNRIHGEDDLGLRAELMKQVLETIPESEVLSILPETAVSLNSLTSMGQMDIAGYLKNWEQSQAARLKHMQFQLTRSQEEVIEKALTELIPLARKNQGESPNVRGTALYLLCKSYLERKDQS